MSDTPRTDAKEKETERASTYEHAKRHAHYGWKFAGQLEREITTLRQQVAELEARLSAYREALERIDRHVLDDMTYPEGYRELREIARQALAGDTKKE